MGMTRDRAFRLRRLLETMRANEELSSREFEEMHGRHFRQDVHDLKNLGLVAGHRNRELSGMDRVHQSTRYWAALPIGGPYVDVEIAVPYTPHQKTQP